MAGLIDVNILKPELSNALAAGYRGAEQARQQSEMNQMKLEQLKQDRAMLTELQTKLKAAGQSTDPNEFFKALIQTGNPDYMAKGYEGMQRYQELQRAERLLGAEFGAPAAAAPAPANALAAGAPTGAAPAPANAMAAAPALTAAAPAAAAPANAMVAAPDRAQELRRKIMQYRSVNDPRLKAMAEVYEAELKELTKPQVVSPGATLLVGGQTKFIAPAAPSTLARLQSELAALPPGDPRRAEYQALIRKETTHAPGTVVNLPPQEKAFESELGKGQADRVLKSKAAAEDAAQILQTNQVGRDILKSGAITGAGANFFVGLNNALKQGGVDFGYADAAANSQAYAAAMAQNVGKLIKQYGAGTGLSDADRDFATQAAGGKINLDEKAIRKILDINDRAANFVIDRHNKDVKSIKTNIPLAVEKPVFEQQRPPAAAQIPGQSAAPAAIPQDAIDALKAGRGTDAQFDEIFGPGAAKRVRGGK